MSKTCAQAQHLTLKREATQPAAANVLQQQALDMKVPADVYARSPRVYRELDEVAYPFHDTTITVTHCGRTCFSLGTM